MNIPEYHEVVNAAIQKFNARINEAREDLDNELQQARSNLLERQDVAVEKPYDGHALRSTH